MSRIAACPDLVKLRAYSRNPATAPATDSVRAHLESCEGCRALVAGFGPDDVKGNVQTLADEPGSLSERVAQADDTMHFFLPPKPAAGAGEQQAIEHSFTSDAATGDLGFELGRAAASSSTLCGAADLAIPATNATVCVSSGSPDQETMCVSVSALPRAGTTGNDSSETYFLPVGQDSTQPSGSGSNFPATKCDIPDGPLPKAIGLEGVTVPGYDILEELGRGGMGVVYKARHRRLRRLVALKMVLAGAHVGQAGLARFRAEAEAVAKLVHPNIVQIFETGEHEGRPYFSLEFVEGGSLDQRINKSPTTPRLAAEFVEILARTMDVAHQRGIVHRDLKPANILLANLDSSSSVLRTRDSDSATLPGDHWSRTTVPKIADFGLAKRTDDDSSQTQSGAILGTPSYMAPEQAGGKTREIGPAVDTYATRCDPLRNARRSTPIQGGQPNRYCSPGHRARPGPSPSARTARFLMTSKPFA